MKRISFLLVMLVLMLNLNVSASSGVNLSVECENLKLSRGEEATCDLNAFAISTISVDNVSLDIESDDDLSITYTKGQYFDGSFNSGRLVLSSDALKTGDFKLGKITIKVSENATFEKKSVVFKNISFTDSSNTTEIYDSEDVTKEINLLSSNNNLKNITIDGKTIDNFAPATLIYNLEVEKEKVVISSEADESDLAKIDGNGEKKLDYGKNTFEVKVTSQSGDTKIYVLNITRKDNRSDVNTLKELTIEGINFNFKTNTLNYKINVESDVEKVVIDSVLTDSKSSYVKDFGNREVELKYGENNILVKVLSEKGTEKVYTLAITRADDRSDVAELTSLKINNKEVELIDDVYEYEVELLYRFEKTVIDALGNDKSIVKFDDIDLKVGDNPLAIKVISEKETEKEYKINVKRLTEEESKAVLENIKIEGYELNFTKDIENYDLEINKEDEELNFEFFSNDLESITYNIENNENLKNGSIIKINVKDDFEEYVYTINIIKEVDEKLIFGFLKIEQLCYIIFVIGVLIFLCSIIYSIKVKSNKKK